MEIYVEGSRVSKLTPLFEGHKITVGIDSSKTNTAILVHSFTDDSYTAIELNGTADKDIYQLCKNHRKELRTLFKGCKFLAVGIEDILTKKNEGIQNTHEVRFKLTFLFSSLVILFEDSFNEDPEPVNNQAWKNLILGPELNKKDIYKGSTEYVARYFPKYKGFSNDVTDAYCILKYIEITHKLEVIRKVEEKEKPSFERTVRLFSPLVKVNRDFIRYEYNYDLTLDENADYISNRGKKDGFSYAEVEVAKLSLKDLTSYLKRSEQLRVTEPVLNLIVYNKEGRD